MEPIHELCPLIEDASKAGSMYKICNDNMHIADGVDLRKKCKCRAYCSLLGLLAAAEQRPGVVFAMGFTATCTEIELHLSNSCPGAPTGLHVGPTCEKLAK